MSSVPAGFVSGLSARGFHHRDVFRSYLHSFLMAEGSAPTGTVKAVRTGIAAAFGRFEQPDDSPLGFGVLARRRHAA